MFYARSGEGKDKSFHTPLLHVHCVFCRIARGAEHACIVHRGENVIAFLDKYPVSLGHTLIAPIEHYSDVFEVPERVLAEMIVAAKLVASAQKLSLGATGVKLVMNNGREAGQEVFHAHLHVIPYGVARLGRRELRAEECEEVAGALREAIGRLSRR